MVPKGTGGQCMGSPAQCCCLTAWGKQKREFYRSISVYSFQKQGGFFIFAKNFHFKKANKKSFCNSLTEILQCFDNRTHCRCRYYGNIVSKLSIDFYFKFNLKLCYQNLIEATRKKKKPDKLNNQLNNQWNCWKSQADVHELKVLSGQFLQLYTNYF